MSFMLKKKKYKFQVNITLEEITAVPYVNAILFAKIRLLDGGSFSSVSSREEVRKHTVRWNNRFQFACKVTANASTGVLEPCICRISVRKEARGGRSFHKLGFVDLNLVEYAGAGKQTCRHLLEGYGSCGQRQDNSLLLVSVELTLLAGDPCFKTPKPGGRSIAYSTVNEEVTGPPYMDAPISVGGGGTSSCASTPGDPTDPTSSLSSRININGVAPLMAALGARFGSSGGSSNNSPQQQQQLQSQSTVEISGPPSESSGGSAAGSVASSTGGRAYQRPTIIGSELLLHNGNTTTSAGGLPSSTSSNGHHPPPAHHFHHNHLHQADGGGRNAGESSPTNGGSPHQPTTGGVWGFDGRMSSSGDPCTLLPTLGGGVGGLNPQSRASSFNSEQGGSRHSVGYGSMQSHSRQGSSESGGVPNGAGAYVHGRAPSSASSGVVPGSDSLPGSLKSVKKKLKDPTMVESRIDATRVDAQDLIADLMRDTDLSETSPIATDADLSDDREHEPALTLLLSRDGTPLVGSSHLPQRHTIIGAT